MQVLKEEVRQNILKAAKMLFLQKGFEMASMNMIAKNAGISKSNLYNYFASKETIFYALTDRTYQYVQSVFENLLNHETEAIGHFDIEGYMALAYEELIILFIKHREELLLIMDCSKGTRLENTKHKLITRLEAHHIAELEKHLKGIEKEDFCFFAHYISNSLIEGLTEIIRHNKNDEWIKNNIKMFVNYYIGAYSHFLEDYI